MKKTIPLFLLCALVLGYFTVYPPNHLPSEERQEEEGGEYKAMTIKDAFADNFEKTKDPALGYPPVERLLPALEQIRRQQQQMIADPARNSIEKARFRERGPNNIGGRTRALLIDQRDPSGNTIWAGSVSGGLWKTDDITASVPQWRQINDYLSNLSISGIAQDANNPEIMYIGTGEAYNNADAVTGMGVFKSVDGGETWTSLPSTLGNFFRSSRTILVHPVTSDVYLGSPQGLFRSQNGGDSWEKVLGFVIPQSLSSDKMFDLFYADNGQLFASTNKSVHRSTTGNLGEWEDISDPDNGFPTGWSRVELAVYTPDPRFLYVVGSDDGEGTNVYATTNGGLSWVRRGAPAGEGNDFTNGQAWYDLDIAVDPFDPNHIIAGGVRIYHSFDGGISWGRFANNMHVDQHYVLFDPARENVVYFGNDGGVYRSENGSAPSVQNRNRGYNVTQFYACAVHPEAGVDYFLGGTQDNNSLQIQGAAIQPARAVRGGDGFFCHIDEDNPDIQIVSSQYGRYGISFDGGNSFDNAVDVEGRFSNPSDYDDQSDIMYAQTNNEDADYYRWSIGGTAIPVNIAGEDINASAITVDFNIENRVYFGSFNGRLVRVDNAHEGEVVEGQLVKTFGNVVISSIDVERGNPDHLLVTLSNYGINSIFESKNGGNTWINLDNASLPDIPVRWGVFNPKNADQALIATEAGVWLTENIDGANTTWIPPLPGRGTPLVRTDMLQVRHSDGLVLAATHGRGLFTTDVFMEPDAKIFVNNVHYTDSPRQFFGDRSTNACDFLWEFGDGNTSTEENPVYAYDQPGTYDVTLTINPEEDGLVAEREMKILPDLTLPYLPTADQYGGDFETRTEQYGVYTSSGSSFERGQSTIPNKDGTHSGDFAYVLGPNEEFYQPNTIATVQLPNFDLSETGIYEFSFWAKYNIQTAADGLQVQYSTDRGLTWQQLGEQSDSWYTYQNDNFPNSAFGLGRAYFSGNQPTFKQFKTNISFLGGQKDVAFRFLFRSEGSGNHRGVAIDDVEIFRYDVEAETKLLSFQGEYTTGNKVALSWTTQPEFYAQRFVIERSYNGRDFVPIDSVNAKNGLTAALTSYNFELNEQKRLIFYRLKVVNKSTAQDYFLEFYSPTIVLRRNVEAGEIFTVFPNPFESFIGLTFTDLVEAPFTYQLYDAAGRLLTSGQASAPDGYVQLETGRYPAGVYFLQLNIAGQEAQVYKLLSAGS